MCRHCQVGLGIYSFYARTGFQWVSTALFFVFLFFVAGTQQADTYTIHERLYYIQPAAHVHFT